MDFRHFHHIFGGFLPHPTSAETNQPLKAHQVYAHQVGHGKELNLLAAEIADLRGQPEVMVTTVNNAILNGESMVNLWLIYG